jgi:carbamoyl-phosphate synthase large subunit
MTAVLRPAADPAPVGLDTPSSRLLVTGAGGPAGVAVINALADGGHHVVAVDSDVASAGLFLAADQTVVAPASEPERFVSDLAAAVDKFDVDAVISSVAEEMLVLSGHEPDVGADLWVPDADVVRTCLDKWRFWEVLGPTDVPVAATARPTDGLDALLDTLPGPWVVKPRSGRGSRDVHFAVDRDELAWAVERVTDPIVQTRAPGTEFTVDVLTDRDGRVAGAVPRWRLETRAGVSTKGRTFDDPRVIDAARRTVERVGLQGVANVQGFVADDGHVVIIEVNPRFSGGLPLSLAAGADLVGEFLRGTLGLDVQPGRLRFRPGVTMLRHFSEVYSG